jgi:hypothetical protein
MGHRSGHDGWRGFEAGWWRAPPGRCVDPGLQWQGSGKVELLGVLLNQNRQERFGCDRECDLVGCDRLGEIAAVHDRLNAARNDVVGKSDRTLQCRNRDGEISGPENRQCNEQVLAKVYSSMAASRAAASMTAEAPRVSRPIPNLSSFKA